METEHRVQESTYRCSSMTFWIDGHNSIGSFNIFLAKLKSNFRVILGRIPTNKQIQLTIKIKYHLKDIFIYTLDNLAKLIDKIR
jgi:hypothetical protein